MGVSRRCPNNGWNRYYVWKRRIRRCILRRNFPFIHLLLGDNIMPSFTIKVDDRFMEWSTVSDGPNSPLMPEELYRKFYRAKYGFKSVHEMEMALKIAKETGVGVRCRTRDVEEILSSARCGKSHPVPRTMVVDDNIIDSEKELDEYLKELEEYYVESSKELMPAPKS